MNIGRLRALFLKELLEVSRNLAVLLPVGLITIVALVLPFAVALMIPALTGHSLSDDRDLVNVSSRIAGPEGLSGEAKIQFFLFQQFLLIFLLMPITGAMALAAHSVVGEKQARTLEPLLATPVTTVELLVAKILGALLPAVGLTFCSFAIYVSCVALVASPGVFETLLGARALAIVFLLGPLAALAALQLAVCVSSRVNDARSAQQIGALVILPISGLLVAQLTGAVVLTVPMIGAVSLALAVINAALMRVAVALFDRESILARWK